MTPFIAFIVLTALASVALLYLTRRVLLSVIGAAVAGTLAFQTAIYVADGRIDAFFVVEMAVFFAVSLVANILALLIASEVFMSEGE